MDEVEEVESVDELGPVDWIVVEFPDSRFKGEIAPALQDLVERELVRVLDLLVLKKDSDGTLEAFELSDLDHGEIGDLWNDEPELAMLLSDDDATANAEAIEAEAHMMKTHCRFGEQPATVLAEGFQHA